jgi:hypothetical protein
MNSDAIETYARIFELWCCDCSYPHLILYDEDVTMHDLMRIMLIQWLSLMNRNPLFKFWFS